MRNSYKVKSHSEIYHTCGKLKREVYEYSAVKRSGVNNGRHGWVKTTWNEDFLLSF
jgi:hypothetical protein